jgi:hypothetical protein
MPDADHVPTWPELIILMCFGESEEQPFTGIVEVDDRYADDEDDPLPRTVRVHKSGSRYRVETLDGQPLYIRAADRGWRIRPGGDTAALVNDDDEYIGGSYADVIERPNPTRWRGNDFTTPTGPATRTSYLGREAWQVEIAPPPHKPAPITLIIDAATGMQLRWGNDEFGDIFRWTDIDREVELADELFTWDGPFGFAYGDPEELPADVRAMVERGDAERAEKAKALRVPSLTVQLSAKPELFDVGDDGSFHAMFDFGGFVIVERRPHSLKEWENDDDREHSAWTEGGWDWRLRLSDDLDPSELSAIRAQLAKSAGPILGS